MQTSLARIVAILAGAAGAYFTAVGNAAAAAPCVYVAGHLAGWTQSSPKDKAAKRASQEPPQP
jgi:hypothetical protein